MYAPPRFPPHLLKLLRDTLVNFVIATHDVSPSTIPALQDALRRKRPLKVKLDGRPNLEAQDFMRRSHLIDAIMQLIAFPQLLGITLDELATSLYAEIRQLLMLCYKLLFCCLNSDKVKAYICLGRVFCNLSIAKTHGASINYLRELEVSVRPALLSEARAKRERSASEARAKRERSASESRAISEGSAVLVVHQSASFVHTACVALTLTLTLCLRQNSTLDSFVASLKNRCTTSSAPDSIDHRTKWIDLMVSHLGFELGNAEVLSSLVRDNVYLLETVVNEDMIQTFIDLIKSRGPQSRFLNFLKVLCSFKQLDGTKRGITQNQELLMDTIFKPTTNSDIIIETALELNPSELTNSTYNFISEILSTSPSWSKDKSLDVAKDVLGSDLLATKFPSIMVSWAAVNFWFPGSGSEFGLFHHPNAIMSDQESLLHNITAGDDHKQHLFYRYDVQSSVIIAPQHRSRTLNLDRSTGSAGDSYDDTKKHSTPSFSDKSNSIIESLRDLISYSHKEKNSWIDFHNEIAKCLHCDSPKDLVSRTMTMKDFSKICENLQLENAFYGSTANEEHFFRECLIMVPPDAENPVLSGNAEDIIQNLIKCITAPTHDLPWVKLEDIAWTLDPKFMSPTSHWRNDFNNAIHRAEKAKGGTDADEFAQTTAKQLRERVSTRALTFLCIYIIPFLYSPPPPPPPPATPQKHGLPLPQGPLQDR